MKKKLIIATIILVVFLLAIFIVRPYSNVELNAATIYYQSYSQLYVSVNGYVNHLEAYYETKDNARLRMALVNLEAIRDNLRIFRLANQSQFRNTIINEKVVKSDFLDAQLQPLQHSYDYSWDVIIKLIENETFEEAVFEDFLHYNQLILEGLASEDYGYHSDTKEFRVVLDENNRSLLDEGIAGIQDILNQSIRISTSDQILNKDYFVPTESTLYFVTHDNHTVRQEWKKMSDGQHNMHRQIGEMGFETTHYQEVDGGIVEKLRKLRFTTVRNMVSYSL